MGLFEENELRKVADPPTIKMIDKWRSISTEVFGTPIEVTLDNRRKNPNLSLLQGEVNVAFPAGYRGRVVLSVWLDSFPDFEPILLAHEVGHWVLKLQGFRGFIRDPRDQRMEGLLNSLASHPPLYALQRSIGQDPQEKIESRCDSDIRLYSNTRQTDPLVGALYLTDDLLNCTWKKGQELKWTIGKYHPSIMKMVSRIIEMASSFDLTDPANNLAFRRRLIRKLEIPSRWIEKDDAKEIRALILKVEKRQP